MKTVHYALQAVFEAFCAAESPEEAFCSARHTPRYAPRCTLDAPGWLRLCTDCSLVPDGDPDVAQRAFRCAAPDLEVLLFKDFVVVRLPTLVILHLLLHCYRGAGFAAVLHWSFIEGAMFVCRRWRLWPRKPRCRWRTRSTPSWRAKDP